MRFKVFVFTLLLLSLLSGCSDNRQSTNSEGVFLIQIPSFSKDGQAEAFKTIQIKNVSDLETMSTSYVDFYFSPKISDNQMVGEKPRGRFFKNSQGIYVPGDALSVQMASLAYHYQQLAELDEQVGAKAFLVWPRRVALSFRNFSSNSLGEWKLEKNNAFYDGYSDSTLFLPYDFNLTALTLNAGVVAHEHFHALFQRQVINQLVNQKYFSSLNESFFEIPWNDFKKLSTPESDPNSKNEKGGKSDVRLQKALQVRVINEGLADVWGWIFSGDFNFVSRSLPVGKNQRSLYKKKRNDSSEVVSFHGASRSAEGRMRILDPSEIYLYGSLLSQEVLAIAEEEKNSHPLTLPLNRIKFAKGVFHSLPAIAEYQLQTDENLSISKIVAIIKEKLAKEGLTFE